ncbi:MAG: Ig-like domain-containing protein [Bacteroidota bacterium]
MNYCRIYFFLLLAWGICSNGIAQDWDSLSVPPSPGAGRVWELQEAVSDDFNYEFEGVSEPATIGGKWTNFYHNGWTGPAPTFWKRDHIYVEDGQMKVKTSRTPGDSITLNTNGTAHRLARTNLGCATSVQRIQYPVYIETRVKIMKAVLASDVWLLSPDDTQEIDICEAYGSSRWNNEWFSDKRIHLSHHVFIRQPFTDWQPSDEGSFYTDGSTIWSDGFHRIGVYWLDPWNLEYYVDGQLVRVRSGKDQIDPVYRTNAVNPGDTSNDTRTGLSKPMDIIINTEDQTWRAIQGLTPTEEELADGQAHTFGVDWVRVYKPVEGEVGPVNGVILDPEEAEMYAGGSLQLKETIDPYNANDLSVSWASDNPAVATVDEHGLVTAIAEGEATITVTTQEGGKTATCQVSVLGELLPPSVSFSDESFYLETEFYTGEELPIEVTFHAGSGEQIIEGGLGGIKFWLREIQPGWVVANDYVISDSTAIGKESGTATVNLSLEGVPTSAEIPADNWYFLFIYFKTSGGKRVDKGVWPIQIGVRPEEPEPEPEPPVILPNGDFGIFPNPTTDQLYLRGEILQEAFSLRFLNSVGQVIASKSDQLSGEYWEIDVSHLAAGHYRVQLITADAIHEAPLVKW